MFCFLRLFDAQGKTKKFSLFARNRSLFFMFAEKTVNCSVLLNYDII